MSSCFSACLQFKKGDKVMALTPGFFNASPEGEQQQRLGWHA